MTDSVFPIKSTVSEPDRDPDVVSYEDADDIFEALSSQTARDVVTALCAEPATPSELADRIGASVQTVTYHLGNLTDAGIIAVIDTWYSTRGTEMDVYALSEHPVVLCIGDGDSERAVSSAVDDDSDRRGPSATSD